MDDEIRELLDRRFAPGSGSSRGADRTSTLHDAITRHVHPGDRVHLGVTHSRGTAAAWEMVRQFRGTDPGFELHAVALSTPMAPLIHAGLARHVVTSWSGDSYYTPGPNAVYQRAWASGDVSFEHWTILTYVQRLASAARGLAWTTTRSILGSTMATDNAASFREVEPGVGLMRSLTPDVSLFHAPAADAAGNVLMVPPLMESTYGALAAKRGAIVTVEKIVDDAFIREHSHLTRIPASAVLAVVEAPFGGHPGGVFTRGIRGIKPYGEDYAAWNDLREASKDPALMDAWIKEWIEDPGSHSAYVNKLGQDRIDMLVERSSGIVPRDVTEAIDSIDFDAPPNMIETAIIATSRVLAERIRKHDYRTMLAGAGMANLAAWLAAASLREEGYEIDPAAEMGLVGYRPQAGEPYLFNHRNFPGCSMLADIDWTLSILIGGATARSIGALGAAQVDVSGNLNSTMIPGTMLLMGSGGANDVAIGARESVVVVSHSRERMLPRVDYVTCPGDRIRTVVSTLGVFRKDESNELVLTDVFEHNVEKSVREATARCGWPLRAARIVQSMSAPEAKELRTLRLMDPVGWFRK